MPSARLVQSRSQKPRDQDENQDRDKRAQPECGSNAHRTVLTHSQGPSVVGQRPLPCLTSELPRCQRGIERCEQRRGKNRPRKQQLTGSGSCLAAHVPNPHTSWWEFLPAHPTGPAPPRYIGV
jgi:hypothetical protein